MAKNMVGNEVKHFFLAAKINFITFVMNRKKNIETNFTLRGPNLALAGGGGQGVFGKRPYFDIFY